MADIQQALVEHLTADAGVTNLAGGRVYPEAVPMPSTYPRCYFRREGGERPKCLAGSARQPVTRLSVICQGQGRTGYADAQALALAVLDSTGGVVGGQRLEDFGGAWLGRANKVWVKAIQWEDPQAQEPEQAPAGEQKRIHGIELICTVHWNEVSFS